MKRILTTILALILILSGCPNVYATEAEEELGYSEALANMDPKIKEIIASQMSQEEKDALVALDPSLEDALLLKVFSLSDLLIRERESRGKTIDAISSAVKQTNLSNRYYLLSDTPQRITFSKDPDSGAVSVVKKYWEDLEILLQSIIMNLAPQVAIDGNTVDVTGIYLFGELFGELYSGRTNFAGGVAVCILTKAGPLFHFHGDPRYDPRRDLFILTESEFKKYIDQYIWYCKIKKHAHNDPNLLTANLHHFIEYYDMYMENTHKMQAKLRRQALKTYGPIALGGVLVAGAAAVGVVIYRKRRKAVLPIEVVADPVDDP